MGVLSWLKGAVSKMLGKESIQQALSITPVISDAMRESIELWESMYKNEAPWLSNDVHSLGLASLIASEKARMATIEMEIKITGENPRADEMRKSFAQVQKSIRKQLEYGLALGGIVIKPYVVKGPNDKYKIKFSYTKATDFYPLSFSADGELTSAAFLDRIITKEKVYSKLEIHSLKNNNTVEVQNRVFVADYNPSLSRHGVSSVLGKEILLTDVPEWASLEPFVTLTNVDTLLFAYFRNPEANTIDISSPLGVSGYARAAGLIKEADEQYSNLLWEFEGGQLALDVDWTALNPMKDKDGKMKSVLPRLQDRLYRRNLDLGDDNMYNVFSPALRDSSIINGLNNILMHIEDACCLSRGTISEVTSSEARTATELKILKQRAFSANADIQKQLQEVFEQLFNIMDIYCDMYNIVGSGEYEVAYKWDDSILVDKDSERQIDIIDITNGLMSKLEYRMKWFGETETQAQESLDRIQEEQQAKLEMQQQAMVGASSNPTDTEISIPSQNKNENSVDEAKKKKRATESNETTKSDDKKQVDKAR